MPSIHSIDIALVMPPGPLRDAILYAFHELKAHVAHNHPNPSNWSGLAAGIEQAGADVLLFDLTCLDEPDLTKSIGEVKSRMPYLKIIAVYPYHDPAKILLAMRIGAHEFVHSPVGPALAAAFKRTAEFRAPADSHRARVIGVVSAGPLDLFMGTCVFVLPAPAQLLPGDRRIEQIQQMIRFMRTRHNRLVLDFGRCDNPLLPAVAGELDELFAA